jgi:hypothetical protein
VLSSSHDKVALSSSASWNRTQPSTPSPPAHETACATRSEGVNARSGARSVRLLDHVDRR